MTDRWVSIRGVYDTVAVDYAQLVRVDPTEGTADLALLEDFAARVRGRGPVLDAGCGRAGSPATWPTAASTHSVSTSRLKWSALREICILT